MPIAGAIHLETAAGAEEYGRVWAFDQESGTRFELETKGAAGGNSMRTRTDATTTPALAATDEVLICTAAGARTVGTPAAATSRGQIFVIKDGAGTGAAANITVDPNGAETIDGGATKAVVAANWGTARIISDGTNWLTL